MPMNKYHVPSVANISELLTSLLGAEIQAKECEQWQFANSSYNLAIYKTDTDDIAVFCITDFAACAIIAGLISQLKSEAINEVIKSNKLTQELIDNAKEVMNITASLFNSNNSPHIVFREFQTSVSQVNDGIKKIIEHPDVRLDALLTVAGYSDCHLTIISAPYVESKSNVDWEWVDVLIDKLQAN